MFSFIKWFNSIDSLGYSFHLYCQSNVQFQGKVTPRIQILTSHRFFIVLAQVDQVPQSWIKLFHHTLNKQDKQKDDERSFRSELKHSWSTVTFNPCWLPIHRSPEPWPLGACAPQSYDWQTHRKQLENLSGGRQCGGTITQQCAVEQCFLMTVRGEAVHWFTPRPRMQETLTNHTWDVKLLKLGFHNSGTWKKKDLRHKGNLAPVCCSSAGARGDACLGAHCIVLQHRTQAAKLLTPKSFFPAFQHTKELGGGA